MDVVDHAEAVRERREELERRKSAEMEEKRRLSDVKIQEANVRREEMLKEKVAEIAGDHSENVAANKEKLSHDAVEITKHHLEEQRRLLKEAVERHEAAVQESAKHAHAANHEDAVKARQLQLAKEEEARLENMRKKQEEATKKAEERHQQTLEDTTMKAKLMEYNIRA